MSNLFTEVSVEQQEIVAGGWGNGYKYRKNTFNFPRPSINTQVAANTTIITQVPISFGNGNASAGALVLQGLNQSK